jgi:hypothetical protein
LRRYVVGAALHGKAVDMKDAIIVLLVAINAGIRRLNPSCRHQLSRIARAGPIFEYDHLEHLLASLVDIIAPAEAKVKDLEERRRKIEAGLAKPQ